MLLQDVKKKDAPTTLEGQAGHGWPLRAACAGCGLALPQVEALLVQKRQRQAVKARVREGVRKQCSHQESVAFFTEPGTSIARVRKATPATVPPGCSQQFQVAGMW